MLDRNSIIGVVGAGTMGTGITQVAVLGHHNVVLYDIDHSALLRARNNLNAIINKLIEKRTIHEVHADEILARIDFTDELDSLSKCFFIIEAVFEDPEVKKQTIEKIERVISDDCIIATNTSSLSIASIASFSKKPEKIIGTHFFNPAPLMPLVEIIPGIKTSDVILQTTRKLIEDWGKTTVIAKDTPGFIVNRIARPFYGEALRIYEEGIADFATIDWAMKEVGGFRMGPFELMDLIGNDVNYKVTESVFEAFHFDPRYKPSFTQKRMVEAGLLGKKSGRGFYGYSEGSIKPEPDKNQELGNMIFERILAMLINEAVDAVFWNIASHSDIDIAMKNGVNYPKGLLEWSDEIGLPYILAILTGLQDEYSEDRYRPSPLIKRMVKENRKFFAEIKK